MSVCQVANVVSTLHYVSIKKTHRIFAHNHSFSRFSLLIIKLLFHFGNIFATVIFSNFHSFHKNHTWGLLLTSCVSADIGNQLKVRPNVTVTDDALMQQWATAHCACKMDWSNANSRNIRINWSVPMAT